MCVGTNQSPGMETSEAEGMLTRQGLGLVDEIVTEGAFYVHIQVLAPHQPTHLRTGVVDDVTDQHHVHDVSSTSHPNNHKHGRPIV